MDRETKEMINKLIEMNDRILRANEIIANILKHSSYNQRNNTRRDYDGQNRQYRSYGAVPRYGVQQVTLRDADKRRGEQRSILEVEEVD